VFEGLDDRPLNDLVDVLRVCPTGEEADANCDQSINDPMPELLQVLQEAHGGH